MRPAQILSGCFISRQRAHTMPTSGFLNTLYNDVTSELFLNEKLCIYIHGLGLTMSFLS